MNTAQRAEVEKLLGHIAAVTGVWRDTGVARHAAILRSVGEIRDVLADVPLFIVGQRVLVEGCIGTVVRPERDDSPNTESDIWVRNPSRGYASRYSTQNIQPLPNGQL